MAHPTQVPNSEDIGLYKPGGFHPIHIGDKLSAYTILNKLGHGGSSTVWLGRHGGEGDSEECVAIAVHKAEVSRSSKERFTTRWWELNNGRADHPGRDNVLRPLDWFEVEGPNGTHFCLVLTVGGPTLSAATRRGESGAGPLPWPMACRVAADLIHGLEYAHDVGLAHSDLHPQNVLLGLGPEAGRSAAAMQALSGPPKIVPLHPDSEVEGSQPSQPRYLVEPVFSKTISLEKLSGPAKIADWGESFLSDDPPSQSAWCGPYITPEFNSPGHICRATDVWCLGCLLFEIFTGYDLFGVLDDPPQKVMNAMMGGLGVPPDHLLEDWVAHVGKTDQLDLVASPRPLHEQIREAISQSYANVLSEAKVHELCDFLVSMIVYEPSERPTTRLLAERFATLFPSI